MKLSRPLNDSVEFWSHPSRGAWIEMMYIKSTDGAGLSHPSRGAWIEMMAAAGVSCRWEWSHPSRGAWIEIIATAHAHRGRGVAPLTGCVD